MPATVRIVNMRSRVAEQGQPGCTIVNTCSNAAADWQRDLSPFILGPCKLWGGHQATRMENAWQFSKVYKQHVGDDGWPTEEWGEWAYNGWADSRAHRYPMGRGRKPEYSYWEVDGKPRKMLYIEARKTIYAPLYAKAVIKTEGFKRLKKAYEESELLVLRDFDGWDYTKKSMTLSEVLNLQNKIMGHACVLAMLLTKDKALKELVL